MVLIILARKELDQNKSFNIACCYEYSLIYNYFFKHEL